MEYGLTRREYEILRIMKEAGAVSHRNSLAVEEVRELAGSNMSAASIYKHLKSMITCGLVEYGASVGQAHGFVLTREALELAEI